MKVDYIIVGLGLAGLAFAEQLAKHHKSFIVFENNSQNSSLVAGGVYNPVILKRFTPVWEAANQLNIALPFYKNLEEKLGIKIDYKFATQKVFKNVEDQNNWFAATDKPNLTEYLNPKISTHKIDGIVGDFGFGEVYQTGRIDTQQLLNKYRELLVQKKRLQNHSFQHSELTITSSEVTYHNITAKQIVFCEGYGMITNPFFNYLPLKEAKGETITIKAPDLKVDFLIKSTLFVLPLGDDLYKVGATFNWKDKTNNSTEEGKAELVEKLKKTIDVPYTIVEQSAGIRPTVKDRRPLVGQHPKHHSLYILNGMGTRGVMIAPWAAKQLYQHIENNEKLHSEIDINRF